MNDQIFDKLDFGPLKPLLDNDDITDISYCNKGQIWIRSLTQGSQRIEVAGLDDAFMERLAFQCSNVMGTTFNNAKPFLDAESTELRLNFVHDTIATNGLACVIRKTPAKIRLEKEKLLKDDYFTANIHDTLIKCVEGHCNIIVCGETGSGKTEFVKYLASHTKEDEKIITIEDTLELHLDRIFPHRDIVAMKTNNVASYSDVLVTCMRQNPKWILLSEVRSAEAVTAVRNSISSGHNILSTIHADKASAIPYRLYSLLESDIEVDQFLNTIYRYIQIGVHIKAYYSKERGKFHREVDEVVEFYVDDDNQPKSHILYQKVFGKDPVQNPPSDHLREYLENQNISLDGLLTKGDSMGDLDDKLEAMEQQTKENMQDEKILQPEEKKDEVLKENPKQEEGKASTVESTPLPEIPSSQEVKPIPESVMPQQKAETLQTPSSVVSNPAVQPIPSPTPVSPTMKPTVESLPQQKVESSQGVSSTPSNLTPPTGPTLSQTAPPPSANQVVTPAMPLPNITVGSPSIPSPTPTVAAVSSVPVNNSVPSANGVL